MRNVYTIPKQLEDVLLSYVKKTYLPEGRANPKYAHLFTAHDVNFFAHGVAEMSAYFTFDRSELPKNYLNKKELLSGYILYFVLANFPKVTYCLEEARFAERFKARDSIKILDLGSGPGTASLAAACYFKDHLPSIKVEISALDQNTKALHDAKHIFQMMQFANSSLKTIYSHLHKKNISQTLKDEKYDIIICSNVLSEAGSIDSQALIAEHLIGRHLEQNGLFVIIEPALRHTTRNLMELRDRLVVTEPTDPATTGHRIVAPCLHDQPCPMLKHNHRDWCHIYLDWYRPDIITKFDLLIGNRKEYLKFSYLIVSALPHRPTASQPHETWRVVSAPLRSKGKIELLICGEKGFLKVTRQDKNASPKNADFDRVQRGHLASYPGCLTIEKDTSFTII